MCGPSMNIRPLGVTKERQQLYNTQPQSCDMLMTQGNGLDSIALSVCTNYSVVTTQFIFEANPIEKLEASECQLVIELIEDVL